MGMTYEELAAKYPVDHEVIAALKVQMLAAIRPEDSVKSATADQGRVDRNLRA